jgi:anti-sigma factor RsiW
VCEAFDHYTQCQACQQFFALQRELRERLKRAGQATLAPRELRDRVYAGLAAARVAEASRRRRSTAWLVAGLVAAAAGWFWFYQSAPSAEKMAQPFVEEVLREMPEGMVAEADSRKLARWFAERLGHGVPVLEIPGAELVGGRIAYIGGVRSAALHYRSWGMPLIYFVVPATSLLGKELSEDRVVTFSSRGFEVVLWREPGALHAVAAPLGRSELVAIAEECRRKLRGAG